MTQSDAAARPVLHQELTLTYDYSFGEVAGTFFDGLREGKILASHCSASKMTYLPPRAYCEHSFEPCDGWVEAGSEGVIEASTIIFRGFEGKRPPPVAVAFVRLDGVDSAIANYIDNVDCSDPDAAMQTMTPGTRVRVRFSDHPQGRITDFSFELLAP